MKNRIRVLCALQAVLGLTSCLAEESETKDDATLGALSAGINLPESAKHDVVRVHFKVVDAAGTCNDPAISETVSAVEQESLPESLLGTGAGLHAFSDGLFVLPVGSYLVCATPLDSADNPSKECAATRGNVNVGSGKTSEVVLISQCGVTPNGGQDTPVVFNSVPVLREVRVGPSQTITLCDEIVLTVVAEDPDTDALSYAWEVVSGPTGASVNDIENQATFTPTQTGAYTLKVTVSDAFGGTVSKVFPLHVFGGECSGTCPPGTVQVSGFCWAVSKPGEQANKTCEAFGLKGSNNDVAGLSWTPELMTQLTSALGCENQAVQGCCSRSLFYNQQTNECFTQSFGSGNKTDYENTKTEVAPNSPAVHACNLPD